MVLDWPQHRNGSKPVTSALNQAIFKAAASVLIKELPNETKSFINALDQHGNTTKKWRTNYISLIEQFVQLQTKASSSLLIESCRVALDFATKSFVVRINDNDDNPENIISIEQAFSTPSNSSLVLVTETLTGTIATIPEQGNSYSVFQLASPHGTDSDPIWITGSDAITQVNVWKEYGCMEPSAAEHANKVLSSTNVSSQYVTKKTFCLLGITSEMGPTIHLLKIPGSHVIGVARPGPKLNALKEWFQINGPIGTTFQFTAADLLKDMVEIAQWILVTAPTNQPLILMPLAYMDGEANVRVTVAMDAIVSHVIQHRGSIDVSLVYLTSPTTIYTIPKEAVLDAKQRYDNQAHSWTNHMISLASFGNWLRPSNSWKQLDEDESNDNDDDTTIIVYNGAYHLQGPNYCLAKLMQQWRCIVANDDDSNVWSVHAPHAPGTRTVSVQHNSKAAVAIEGIQYFPPMVTFDVMPCSSLLTAIILHQLQQGKLKPKHHPMELFWDGAVHGGGWRCPYSSESMIALTFVLGTTFAKPGWCPAGALAPKPNVTGGK